MTNTSTSTDTRVSLSRANSPYGNRDYDVFTYSPQANGSTNNQPVSSHFLSVNLARELSTAQGRTIRVLFGAEYTQDRVRTIRSLAQGSYRNSQISTSVSTSFVDSFYSPSADEFYRQAIPSGSQRIYKTYKVYIAKDDSQAFVVEYQETGPLNAPTTITQNITGIDTSSFVDYQAYFVHNYRTYGYSKQYKQYLYIPSRDTNISSIISNLGIESRMRYHMGTSRFFPISNERTTTYINGYTVNSGYVSYVESIFSSYGNPTYITLPASNTQFSFYPQTSYNFSNVRLSDGTYRMYRLLVAIDGSEAYMTEYIENNPYY